MTGRSGAAVRRRGGGPDPAGGSAVPGQEVRR